MADVVNVDCDGVLYDFTRSMREELLWVGSSEAFDWPDPTTWALHEAWPVGHSDVQAAMERGILEGRVFRYGKPMPGAAEGMRWLAREPGVHVRIVTAKTFDDPAVTHRARRNLLDWLHDWRIPHDTLAFTDSHGKADYRARVVIDDKPDLSWAQPAAVNLLFHQPWNIAVKPAADLRVQRVYGWQQLIDYLRTRRRPW